jgi:hypothetical protein
MPARQHVTKTDDRACLLSLRLVLAKADVSVQLPPHTARHRSNDYIPLSPTAPFSKHHQLSRTDINHELLHPSRILDARANWCVYKSICQLPLDCYLRQPASDRGK